MNSLLLTLSLAFISAPALAKNVDPSCGGSRLLMRGTIFIALALSEETTLTGDDSYDRALRQGVKDRFSKEDAAEVQKLLDANPRLAPILALKAEEFREKGLKGARYMEALVAFYMDPANGLCTGRGALAVPRPDSLAR